MAVQLTVRLIRSLRSDAFVDTASVIMSSDLIITIDTSVAHLAGALGRPTWLCLPAVPDGAGLKADTIVPGIEAWCFSAKANQANWAEVALPTANELRGLVTPDSR